MEYPGGKNKNFRHLLFFVFHRGQKAAEAARDKCNVYGEGATSKRAAQKRLDDTPRSRRPAEFDEEHLKAH